MTIDLYRNDDDFFQFEYFGIWQKLMNLAQIYGWNPAGTQEPPQWNQEEGDWDGSYDIFAGEWVADADAHALAQALKMIYPTTACQTALLRLKLKRLTAKAKCQFHSTLLRPTSRSICSRPLADNTNQISRPSFGLPKKVAFTSTQR